MSPKNQNNDKSSRANASQFIVAGELCRREIVAVVTMGNTPNTDILCSNKSGTRFVHVQVKTYVPGSGTVSVGKKSQKSYGKNFIWVLAGIQLPDFPDRLHEFYIIPSDDLALNVTAAHDMWLNTPGSKGQRHNDSSVRTVALPPRSCYNGWNIAEYKDRWDIIQSLLD